MEKTVIVNMTPNEQTSDGFLKIKEWGQPMLFRFLADPDFRGTLKSVEWNLPDNIKHTITTEDEDFSLFHQVGERPEINVSSSWIESLDLKPTALLRLRFEFETFRQEPVWYAHLYIKEPYGDKEAAYLLDKKSSSECSCSCGGTCEECSCCSGDDECDCTV